MSEDMFNLYKPNGEIAYVNAQDNTVMEVSKEWFISLMLPNEPALRKVLGEIWDYGINKPAELIEE